LKVNYQDENSKSRRGVLNLDNHKFDIKGADDLYIELLPTYTPSQPILVVKDSK